MAFFHRSFCHFRILICLIYLSLPNLYFHTIRSIEIFLKVLTGKFQCACTNLNNILLLTYSLCQNSRSYQLIIIVRLKGRSFFSSVAEVLPCSCCFITCMGVHFPVVELDDAIWFSTIFRMSGFLQHSSKWVHQFGRFLKYPSG